MSERGERQRDGPQRVLNWLVKTTGRVQNLGYDQRVLPSEAKTYRQIADDDPRRAVGTESWSTAASG